MSYIDKILRISFHVQPHNYLTVFGHCLIGGWKIVQKCSMECLFYFFICLVQNMVLFFIRILLHVVIQVCFWNVKGKRKLEIKSLFLTFKNLACKPFVGYLHPLVLQTYLLVRVLKLQTHLFAVDNRFIYIYFFIY